MIRLDPYKIKVNPQRLAPPACLYCFVTWLLVNNLMISTYWFSDLFNQSRYSDQIRPVQDQSKLTEVSPSPMSLLFLHFVTGEQFDDINILVF